MYLYSIQFVVPNLEEQGFQISKEPKNRLQKVLLKESLVLKHANKMIDINKSFLVSLIL